MGARAMRFFATTGVKAMRVGLVALAIAGTATAWAAKADLDYERLRNSLGQLTADAAIGSLAPAEIALAEHALAALAEQGGKGREHDHLVYLAERRIEIAYAVAQAVEQEHKLQRLDREHDQILLAASRRDAEQARLELEKQRIQSQVQAEESDRLRAEADAARAQTEQSTQEADTAKKQAAQARKLAEAQAHEAELARKETQLLEASGASSPTKTASPKASAGPTESIIADAFSSGQAVLKPAAQSHLAQVAATAGAKGLVHVEAHADSSALAQQRARAVHDALVAAGIPSRRISVSSSVVKGAAARQVVVSIDKR